MCSLHTKWQTTFTGKGGTVHVYPYIQNNPDGPERNSNNSEKDARKATDSGELNMSN